VPSRVTVTDRLAGALMRDVLGWGAVAHHRTYKPSIALLENGGSRHNYGAMLPDATFAGAAKRGGRKFLANSLLMQH
jgi:hypothetical protein